MYNVLSIARDSDQKKYRILVNFEHIDSYIATILPVTHILRLYKHIMPLSKHIRRTESVCSDSTIISTYAIVLQLQYIYVISRFTSQYVTKKTLQNKLYTYIIYINDEAEIVNKDDKDDSDDKESGGSGDDDDDDDDDDDV